MKQLVDVARAVIERTSDDAKLMWLHFALCAAAAAAFAWFGHSEIAAGILFGFVVTLVGRP